MDMQRWGFKCIIMGFSLEARVRIVKFELTLASSGEKHFYKNGEVVCNVSRSLRLELKMRQGWPRQ